MRRILVAMLMLLGSVTSASAQVSIGIGLPSVNIGINIPLYPELVPVPGYPVYYAPGMNSNYFFYDGMYWVYQGDNWYASSWYNGPWGMVGPEYVPLFVLRIPVRYYRNPPVYFRGWGADAAPRWGQHWGRDWEQRRTGWDQWDHRSVPKAAPLPAYQRQYSGDRYPRAEQQPVLRSKNYQYQPREAVVQQHFREQAAQKAPAPSQRVQQKAPQESSPRQQDTQRSAPAPRPQQSGPAESRSQPQERRGEDVQRSAPAQAPAQQKSPAESRSQPQNRRGEDVQKSAPAQAPAQQRSPAVQEQRRQPQPEAAQREQPTPRSGQERAPQGKGASQEPRRDNEQEKGQDKGRDKGDERGQDRNR